MWKNAPKKIDESMVGFVYCILEKDTGMMYFGIKKFHKKVRYKPLKGKKRMRIKYLESDWKMYNTSSPIMQEKLKNNPKNYVKVIVRCCDSVTDMKAWEAWYQLNEYLNGDWKKLYNEVINLRLRIRKVDKK